ncbi:hypothetical protein [Vibrio phage vB_VhaP_PG11]|nr:hypothetical protein [Vibrio phage vB_VhaP_PG11]
MARIRNSLDTSSEKQILINVIHHKLAQRSIGRLTEIEAKVGYPFMYKGLEVRSGYLSGITREYDPVELEPYESTLAHCHYVITEWEKCKHWLINALNFCISKRDMWAILPETVREEINFNEPVRDSLLLENSVLSNIKSHESHAMLETLFIANKLLENI